MQDSEDDERPAVDLAPVSRPLDEEPVTDEGEGEAAAAAANGAAEDAGGMAGGTEGEAAAESGAASEAAAGAPGPAVAASSEAACRPLDEVTADLEGVDESLFLGEDFDDDGIE